MGIVDRRIAGMGYKIIYYANTLCLKGEYSIESYDEALIIIKCSSDTVCIKGENLVIRSLGTDEIYITGNITDISFA